jgi:parallel beta-helix repeat protein
MRYSIILVVSIIFFVPAIGFSATLKVPSQYPNIQDAIDAAVKGDTVLVAPGTYRENIDFIGKAITVKSEQGADVTVVDGNQAGSVVTCKSGEGADSVLDGFTITNGYAVDGGGIFCERSSPTISKNIIIGNMATSTDGGGMDNFNNSNPTVINCTFSGNWARYGGGMCNYVYSSPTVTNCTFTENSAVFGGGMCNVKYSSPIVTNCSFSGNLASGGLNEEGYGGGMDNYNYSSPTVINCTFSGNSAIGLPGGFGGGMINNYYCSPTVINTVLWNNYAPEGPEIWIGDTTFFSISHSDVKGGKFSVYVEPGCILRWGGGMIDADPLFVDEANYDFHLTYPSPSKDTGKNSAVTEIADFEGDPRIAYGTVDMGADEFYTHLYWTGDATPGGNVEIKFVGLPGTSPVGLCIGTGVLDPPIPSMWGDWYLAFPIIGPVEMGSITSPEGVLIIPGTIPASPPPPYSIPMQALIGAELTNLSVLEVK